MQFNFMLVAFLVVLTV